ncbi:FecR protein [Rubripirellula tenax]|uniref:FecR protein n=1 Tax=Rubripirellula tenax TaxID=2528015 RepID=A0A5C6FA75_9BACT|nr:LamG-like jellyroll fold domain-containing protein [Rubripirellula tenax]TWU56451.1 FecR protein [Rubripirellula tenax]
MKSPQPADGELQELLADLLDGELSEDARRRLNERLSSDPQAQALYLDFCETHAALSWEHGLVIADLEPSTRDIVPPRTDSISWTRAWTILATLAATFLVAAIAWYSDSDEVVEPTAGGAVVAQLVSRIDAVLTADSLPWETNEIRVGGYEIERGLVQLEFASGVSVLIEAPARFDAVSAERLVLHAGRLSANVPPEGVGFTVETPEADVVDFGTEFSVEVGGEESEVHVFSGHVQVKPKTESGSEQADAIDLRTEQAIRISEATRQPAGIDLATDRFIRSINEPQKQYPMLVKQLGFVAYYRMPIRGGGLACSPKKYAGEMLMGEGTRPAFAPGIVGASLRVGGRSVGRGAHIENPPRLTSGHFSLVAWVYADSRPPGGTVATDVSDGDGRFALSLDRNGRLTGTVTTNEDKQVSVSDLSSVPLNSWQFVVLTLDGKQLRMYRNGDPLVSTPCHSMTSRQPSTLWMGTSAEPQRFWNGRIDELALFDRALAADEIAKLYQAAGTE